MRIGVVDVGNTRVKRALWDGRRLRAWDGGKAELWIGCRVGRAAAPKGALLLGRDFPPLVRNRTRRPESVGADRLAQASAAWRRAAGACVVVGMGTAITVDVVDARGNFLGGLIAPGLRMMARALHRETALLPEVEPVRTRSPLGRDTEEAIRAGISTAAEGLIRRAVDGRPGRVYGTGGDAPGFRDLFDRVLPDLALEGVVHSWLRSRRS
jgi:type III pantothenate kinase